MKRALLISFLSLLSSAAMAQINGAPVEEGVAFVPPPGTTADIAPATAAQLEIRLSTIEDELRRLRGKNEELDFQLKKANERVDRLQRDTDMRFGDLSAPPPAKPQPAAEKPATPAAAEERPEEPKPAAPPAAATTEEFSTPRDLYNHAFRLLNQTKYDDAAAAFASFTKTYPKDQLVGNAYYWQGETHYIRRDYVTAADLFRQGFEALPTGPKAPDNLLKLAMSLDALGRGKEACVVLQQVVSKFKKTSAGIGEKAENEQKRMGCK